MKYFFVLGNNRAISIAEILSVFKEEKGGLLINDGVFLLEIKKEVNADILKQLGGTMKFGQIVFETSQIDGDQVYEKVFSAYAGFDKKISYGISDYSQKAEFRKQQKLAMVLKKRFKEDGRSCRWVTSREKTLSSVVVEENIIKKKGCELVLLGEGSNRLVGKTLAVQPYRELSDRDYGRPSRDDRSGMLPPKLAQIMLNLSGFEKGDTVLDPFCGSGTVLGEAMLMGAGSLIGSDISAKAISDSVTNNQWLEDRFGQKSLKTDFFESDVSRLTGKIKPASVDRIVCEPYLGPQRGLVDQRQVKKELDLLYSRALKVFHKLLADNGRVVMVWPVRILAEKKLFLDPDLSDFKTLRMLENGYEQKFRSNLSFRKNLLYGREGQKVWREIVVLEKEN